MMKQISIGIFTLILIIGLSNYDIRAQCGGVDSGYRGSSYWFREYKEKYINKLSEIPQPALSKIVGHLKERLGEQFYKKLKFDGGDVIDLNELHRVEPYWKDQVVGTYVLLFYFSDKRKGLKAFYSKAIFDAEGKVVEEINYPVISNAPQKAKFIPVTDAMKIAYKNDFIGKHITPYFEYLPEFDSFAWEIHDGSEGTQDEKCNEMVLI